MRLLSAILLSAAVLSARGQSLERFAYSEPHMGTAFNIVLYAPDSARAHHAATAAFARVDSLNGRLSDYLSQSELSRLSRTAGSGRWAPVSDDLWTVLHYGQRVAEETHGAFDMTVGPLSRLWRWAMRRGAPPPTAQLEEPRVAVGFEHVHLDAARRSARLDLPGMRLDLGGIAKGYAADEALKVLLAHGYARALVDAGGDIAVGEAPPGLEGWMVNRPAVGPRGSLVYEEAPLSHRGVATSGATYRFVEHGGVTYSHIVDPRSGLGVTGERLVTVLAPTAMRADALASAFSVMAPSDAVAFASARQRIAVRLVVRRGHTYEILASPDFKE